MCLCLYVLSPIVLRKAPHFARRLGNNCTAAMNTRRIDELLDGVLYVVRVVSRKVSNYFHPLPGGYKYGDLALQVGGGGSLKDWNNKVRF
jgi:hypothetical protein